MLSDFRFSLIFIDCHRLSLISIENSDLVFLLFLINLTVKKIDPVKLKCSDIR